MPAGKSAVNVSRPIQSVRITDSHYRESGVGCQEAVNTESLPLDIKSRESSQQKAVLSQAAQALNAAAGSLRQLYDNAVVRYKEDIARFSVEIARKVLAQKVKNGDYQIESIVKEAMQNTPTDQIFEIHLNPADLEVCKKTLQAELNCPSTGIEFVPNPNIGRAECQIKTAKGTIESLIDTHLERISEALTKAV